MNKKIIDYVIVTGKLRISDSIHCKVYEDDTLKYKVIELLSNGFTLHGSISIYEECEYTDNHTLMQTMVKYE